MTSVSPDDIRKYMMECLVENNLDPNLMNDIKNAKEPSEYEEGCFLACMNKRMGLLRNDGTYNEDVFLAPAQSTDQRTKMKLRFDEIMKKCKIEAGEDICKLAGCVNRQPYDYPV